MLKGKTGRGLFCPPPLPPILILNRVKLFEFAVEWITATEIKHKLLSVQKITFITAIADKKIISAVCVFAVFWSTSVYGSN